MFTSSIYAFDVAYLIVTGSLVTNQVTDVNKKMEVSETSMFTALLP